MKASAEAMLNDPGSVSSPVKITSQLLSRDNLARLRASDTIESVLFKFLCVFFTD